MITEQAINEAISGLSGLEISQTLGLKFFGIALLIQILVPFIVMLMISAATGAIGKPKWWQIAIIPFIVSIIIGVFIIFGFLPFYANLL